MAPQAAVKCALADPQGGGHGASVSGVLVYKVLQGVTLVSVRIWCRKGLR